MLFVFVFGCLLKDLGSCAVISKQNIIGHICIPLRLSWVIEYSSPYKTCSGHANDTVVQYAVGLLNDKIF